MLPLFQKTGANVNHSFYVEQVKFPCFHNPLQFHPDIEIMLIIKGTGILFVGDSVNRFDPGDLIMLGHNVPHIWHSDKKYTIGNSSLFTEVISILFKTEIFGEQFWHLPESKNILKLIQHSQRGIKLTGKTHKEVTTLMRSITSSVGFNRILFLLTILEIIASRKGYEFLASPIILNTINEHNSECLNKVYNYVINNYHQVITLGKVAAIANLSAPAFCRYFKKRANKTFIQFLNEIRIGHACGLLIDEDYSVSRICYSCGFNNVSYFIRKFRKITGFTPLQYQKNSKNKI